jgi:hypothetical protein
MRRKVFGGKRKKAGGGGAGRVDREHAMIGPMTARAATSLTTGGQRALFEHEIIAGLLKIGFCSRPARLWPYHNSSFFNFKFHLATWGRSFCFPCIFLTGSQRGTSYFSSTSILATERSARKNKTRRSSDTGTKAAICVTSLPAIGSRGPLWFHHSHCECL